MHRVWPFLTLLALLLVTYFPCLTGQFIWDDVTFIVDNDLIRRPGGLWSIWFSHELTDYWPISYTAFWLLWRIFGSVTLGYHLVNLGVHALNATLLLNLGRRLGWRSAWPLALLFLLHPVNVESVAWIFQLKTTLAATFALLALGYWLEGVQDFALSRIVLSWACFALALLTKASVLTWPLVLFGCAWAKRRRLERRDLFTLLPFAGLALAVGFINLYWYGYDQVTAGEVIRDASFANRLVTVGQVFCFYWQKAWWPGSLNFVYDFVPQSAAAIGGWVAIVVGGLTLWRLRERTFGLAFGYFAVVLFPVLGLADIYFMRYSLVADHWQYLALPGTLAFFLLGIEKLGLDTRPQTRWIKWAPIPIFAILSWQRCVVFANEECLWRDTLSKNPSAWMAHNNLGTMLLSRGEGEEAVGHFREAIRLKNDYADPYNNIGTYYLGRNERVEAEAYFIKALEVFPGYVRALNNLAAIELGRGHAARATELEEQAVRNLPTYQMGWQNLGTLYLGAGRVGDAKAALDVALRLKPDDVQSAKLLRQIHARESGESIERDN